MNREPGLPLRVGHVRERGLEVQPDPLDEKHALIVGLPYPDEDPSQAERLAGQLARRARFQWRPPERVR